MAWQVLWSKKSTRQLEKMNRDIAQQIFDAVMDCVDDPFQNVSRLANSRFYRLRTGSYRVILDLQQNKMIIFVVESDHRGKIYKK